MQWLWKLMGAVRPAELFGLRLPSTNVWCIQAANWDAASALAALPQLVLSESVIYLEGGCHSDEVSAFISKHQIEATAKITVGTIWPRQKTFHLPSSPDVFRGLSKLADHHATPEICEHLVVYHGENVIIDWYDAFDRDLYVWREIPEVAVRSFCDATRSSYAFEGG